MPGALDGVRVIDFGQYIAGPLAAVMLADQGADVIHVDPPGGPRWKSHADAFYNRGKRRITLDLKSPEGLATARRLVSSADVAIENFRPGVMERLGLDAKAMTEADPRLIYCSIPGFAAADPRAGMEAWEGIIDAATENCFPRAGEPPLDWDSTRPTYSAVPLASNFGGFLGATGIVMALIARHRSGQGQRVEVPLFNAMFTLIGPAGAYPNSRGLRQPTGIHGRGAGCFRCADGKYVQFDTSSARHLTWFAREAGITHWGAELLDIVRLRDPAANDRLHAKLRELFLTRTAPEWEEIGNRAGAAMGWCRTVSEWIETEHARMTGAVVELNDPELGPTWMAGLPNRLTRSPGVVRGPRRLADADHSQVVSELDGMQRPDLVSPDEPDLTMPLGSMRVLDLTLALAGPTCGRLLGEFGADVIKINAPKSGGMSGYLNRGKRSVLLDVESVEGQQLFWKLAEKADVVLENFSPGAADRLGIGYEEVKARNPSVIYASVSCYGRGGPWESGRGWERQGQAVAGIMERTGKIPAILGPYNLIDIGTGVLSTFTIGLGLYHRLVTGQAQHVQASLAQTATLHQAPFMFDFKGFVSNEPRYYEALGLGSLQRFYQASDRWFFLAATEANASRLAAIDGLKGVSFEDQISLEGAFAKQTASVWVGRLRAAGVSAQEVVPLAKLMVDPFVREQGLSVTQVSEEAGEVTMPGPSIKFSKTLMRVGAPARKTGADFESVLADAGMSDARERLEKAWALQTTDLPSAWGAGGG